MHQLDSSPDAPDRDHMWGELYYHMAMTAALVMPFVNSDDMTLIPSADGMQRIPLYTNEDDLRVNFPDALADERCVCVRFDTIMELLDRIPEAVGVVVDLPSLGWIFDREDLQAIADKRQTVADQSDTI